MEPPQHCSPQLIPTAACVPQPQLSRDSPRMEESLPPTGTHMEGTDRHLNSRDFGLKPGGLLIFEDISDFSHMAPAWQRRVP